MFCLGLCSRLIFFAALIVLCAVSNLFLEKDSIASSAPTEAGYFEREWGRIIRDSERAREYVFYKRHHIIIVPYIPGALFLVRISIAHAYIFPSAKTELDSFYRKWRSSRVIQ